MYFQLTDRFVVRAGIAEAWGFFSRAENLSAITPPWLAFKLETAGPVVMGEGALLDYTIRWMGVPIRWRTRIIDWTPERQFIDLQIRGPYALWHHQHTFAESGEGTVCADRVTYKLPVPLIGSVINALVVKKQLMEIFEFRRRVIAERLGWVRDAGDGVRVGKIG